MRFNQFDNTARGDAMRHYTPQGRIARLEVQLAALHTLAQHAARMDIAPDVLQKRAIHTLKTLEV